MAPKPVAIHRRQKLAVIKVDEQVVEVTHLSLTVGEIRRIERGDSEFMLNTLHKLILTHNFGDEEGNLLEDTPAVDAVLDEEGEIVTPPEPAVPWINKLPSDVIPELYQTVAYSKLGK